MPGRKGGFIYFCPPGTGKSTEARTAHQNAIVLETGANNGLYYDRWLLSETGKASGCKPVKKTILLDTYSFGGKVSLDPNGHPAPVSQISSFEMFAQQITSKCLSENASGQPLTYSNVIVDEVGTLWQRVFDELLAQSVTDKGKIDSRAAYGLVSTWSRRILDLLRNVVAAGANLILIAHDQEPDGDRKGGPQFPSQRVMRQITSDMDGVLLRVLLEGGGIDGAKTSKRIWRAHASNSWVSKLRGLPDTSYAQLESMSLVDILREAGYEP